MSITVIVALEYTDAREENAGRWAEVEVPGVTLTARKAETARTQAFGYMENAVVAHGWTDAFWVPGRRTNRGNTRRKWSAERTRRLFGNSREEA